MLVLGEANKAQCVPKKSSDFPNTASDEDQRCLFGVYQTPEQIMPLLSKANSCVLALSMTSHGDVDSRTVLPADQFQE